MRGRGEDAFAAAVYDGDRVGALGTAHLWVDRRGDFQDSLRQYGFVGFVVVRERLGLPTAKMMAIAAVANFVGHGDGDVVAGAADAVKEGDLRFLPLQSGRGFAAKLPAGFDDLDQAGAAQRVQVFQSAGNIRRNLTIPVQRALLDRFHGFGVREDSQVDEVQQEQWPERIVLFEDQPAQVARVKNARLFVSFARGPARGFEVIDIVAVKNARAIDRMADAGNLDITLLARDEDRAGSVARGTGIEDVQRRRDRRVSHGIAIFFLGHRLAGELRVWIRRGVAIGADGDCFQQGLQIWQRYSVDARVFERDQGNCRGHCQSAGAIDGINHLTDDP